MSHSPFVHTLFFDAKVCLIFFRTIVHIPFDYHLDNLVLGHPLRNSQFLDYFSHFLI